MSYTDDEPTCDVCDRPYPPYWPDGFTAPWPVTGPFMEADGRVPADQADNFAICLTCLQTLVLAASLRPAKRTLAIRSRDRWTASEMLLDELKSIDRASAA